MKTFKDLKAFERRVRKGTAWADYFKLGGRMWNIYEYGPFQGSPCYVYFLNKRSNDLIKVTYTLPSINYVDGERVERGAYSFIDLEYEQNASLWR